MQATNPVIYYTPHKESINHGVVADEHTPGAKQIAIPPDIDEGHPRLYALGVTVTVIAVGIFIAANIVAFPFAGPISLLALGILAAVAYGIANDQLACRQCIEYFTVGHTTTHQRLLKTDNPTLNGIVWGIYDTWELGVIAGTVMAITALTTGLVVAPILPYLALAFAITIGVVCLYTHIQVKNKEKEWSQSNEEVRLSTGSDKLVIIPEEGFHPVQLNLIPKEKYAAYLGVRERTVICCNTMPHLGGLAMISLIALSIIL